MKRFDSLTEKACEQIAEGDLLGAHKSILELAQAARRRRPQDAARLAMSLQSTLVLLRRTLLGCGYDVPKVSGDELANALGVDAALPAVVERFEQASHRLLSVVTRKDASRPLAERAKAYIEANYGRPITRTSIAESLGCSRSHLDATFKRVFGATPNQYLLEVRIDHARRLLAQTSIPPKEVAERCGFRSYSTFHRNFVVLVDSTPKQYRHDQRQRLQGAS